MELRILKLRESSYFPGFLEPRRMATKAQTDAIVAQWSLSVNQRREQPYGRQILL